MFGCIVVMTAINIPVPVGDGRPVLLKETGFNSFVAMVIAVLMLAKWFRHLDTRAVGRCGMTDGGRFSLPFGAVLCFGGGRR